MNTLREKFLQKIAPELAKKLKLNDVHAVPYIEKIVVNVGLGEAIDNPQALVKMGEDIAMITGQRPIVTRAKKAISNFKLRPGIGIGLKATLRGDRMWDFYEKLVSIVLPRVRDFRGLPRGAFDGCGNYSIGIREHTVFPEVEPNKIDKLRGVEIVIVTTAKDDKDGLLLLEKLGMPFARIAEERTIESMKQQMKKEKKEIAKIKAKRKEASQIDVSEQEE